MKEFKPTNNEKVFFKYLLWNVSLKKTKNQSKPMNFGRTFKRQFYGFKLIQKSFFKGL